MKDSIKKTELIYLMRDAKWQVKQIKKTHFTKNEVLEILDDILKQIERG